MTHQRGLNRAGGARVDRQAAREQISAVIAQVRRASATPESAAEEILMVPIVSLLRPRWQARQDYEVGDLIDSIEQHGVLEPIGIWRDPEEEAQSPDGAPFYRVLFGNRRAAAVAALHQRRMEATCGAGLRPGSVPVPRIPARLFRCGSPLEAALLTVAENNRRRDLSMIEEGREMEQMAALLREHGLPATDRDLAPIYDRSFSVVNVFRRVGREITDDFLLEAGFRNACDPTRVDWLRVRTLTQELLQRALKASGERRIEVLRRAGADRRTIARRRVPHEVTPPKSGEADPEAFVTGGTETSASSTSVLPELGPLPGVHRYTYEQLRTGGGFKVHLSRPFEAYSARHAEAYLLDVLAAAAALGDQVAGDQRYLHARAGKGHILYLRTDPAHAVEEAELHVAMEAIEVLLSSVREGAKRLGLEDLHEPLGFVTHTAERQEHVRDVVEYGP